MSPRPPQVPPLKLYLLPPNRCYSGQDQDPDQPVYIVPDDYSDELGYATSSSEEDWSQLARPLVPRAGYARDVERVLEVNWEIAEEELLGDFKFRTLDGKCEILLRLQPEGKFWHAAHREITEGEAWPRRIATGIWEMAESLGSWRQVRLPRGTVAVLLTCDNCRWASDDLGACVKLRPVARDREKLDALIAAGELHLCYLVGRSKNGQTTLEMQVSYECTGEAGEASSTSGSKFRQIARDTQLQNAVAAVETLGFQRLYGKGDAMHRRDAAFDVGLPEAETPPGLSDAVIDFAQAAYDELMRSLSWGWEDKSLSERLRLPDDV